MKDVEVTTKKRGPARLGGGKRKNRSERKDGRRRSAELRADARSKRSPQEQLALLAARGVTSGPEVDRLSEEG